MLSNRYQIFFFIIMFWSVLAQPAIFITICIKSNLEWKIWLLMEWKITIEISTTADNFFLFFFFSVLACSVCRLNWGPEVVSSNPLEAHVGFLKVSSHVWRLMLLPCTHLCIFPALGRVMGSMWVFLGHSAITEKSATARGIRTRISEFTPAR